MDSPSSLELFLLAAVEEGCATAYDLHAQAGLSVGSTQPALQRMVKKGWLGVETTGGRGRMQHQLTSRGRKELASWRSLIDQAIVEPPSDMEGLFRMLAITWHKRDQLRLKKLLQAGARQTSDDAVEFSTTLIGFHHWLLGLQGIEKHRSKLRLLAEISTRVKKR